jgi:hypothetical protein
MKRHLQRIGTEERHGPAQTGYELRLAAATDWPVGVKCRERSLMRAVGRGIVG